MSVIYVLFTILIITILLTVLYYSSNEKFGSFSIGAALKTPIIYHNQHINYPGVS